MEKKTASTIILTLLLTSMLTLAFSIQSVNASGTIYIRADGSIDPPDAPISTADHVSYTLTGNITTDAFCNGIVIERGNMVIDGNGYTIQGSGTVSYGILLSGIHNVTIIDVDIKDFYVGIFLNSSSNNVLSGNSITDNGYGIGLHYSSDNNRITGNNIGAGSSHTVHVYTGIQLENSSANVILGNNIVGNEECGVFFVFSPNNTIYHNNFVNNTYQFYADKSVNVWDDGYPSGGNYWSDYAGVDLCTGPNQNLIEGIGSDGIGDTNYTIDGNNVDRYPLTIPWINKTPIHPLEGQYANYTVLSVIHGIILESLQWNLTYHKYVSPFLIYVESWNSKSSGTDWTALNITDRYARHFPWPITGILADLWFPGLIETDITIGSTVNFLNSTATVVDSRILRIEPRSVKCWELTHDEEISPGTYIHHTFWFHETTGLMIGEEVQVGPHQKFNITLVESNILPDYEIVAAYGSTPTIDGTINVQEWSDAASVSFNNTEVFVKQDGTNLYVAFNISDAPFHEQDAVGLYVDAENDRNSSSQPPDMIMGIYINGTLVEGNLTMGTVTQTNVTLWTASFHSDSNMWQAEFNITYSKIGVVAGVEKTLGVVFISSQGEYSTQQVTWPPEDSWDLQYDPSLWGDITSTGYNWIPEFPSLPILLLLTIATLLPVIVYKRKQADRRYFDKSYKLNPPIDGKGVETSRIGLGSSGDISSLALIGRSKTLFICYKHNNPIGKLEESKKNHCSLILILTSKVKLRVSHTDI